MVNYMKKLEARICKCGRIHFYSNEMLSQLLEEEKELMLICSGCGNVTRIGADIEPAIFFDEDADPEEIVYNMYATHSEQEEIGPEDFNKDLMFEAGKRTIGKILIDEGVRVYMKTGYTADYYGNNGFSDFGSNFDRIKQYATLEELEQDMNEYDKLRHEVRMQTLLRELTDDQAETLSSYLIHGLDWSGTKWETEWNSRKDK